ncbi:MAG: peptidylprolyl isomerase [Candidatus Cloacimonetes bacterium]|nr:peptidylprolyl isomerase [Candidatus Cloacimonadota bacterium]
MVAIVNGIRITKDQLRKEKDFITMKDVNLDQDGLYQQALKNLIDAAIILQQSRDSDVCVQECEIDEALVDFLAYFIDEENYKSKLQEVEITEDELRERLERHVRVGKFLAGKFECKDNACEERLYRFFEENRELFTTDDKVRLSHILIPGNCDDSKECAQRIREKLHTPEDFVHLAVSVSKCPSCLQNGDLGYLLPGELIPELDRVAFSMKPGEISDVLQTSFGYHILMVTDFVPARRLEFDEVREFLSGYHQNVMLELNVEKYLAELRKKADIKLL